MAYLRHKGALAGACSFLNKKTYAQGWYLLHILFSLPKNKRVTGRYYQDVMLKTSNIALAVGKELGMIFCFILMLYHIHLSMCSIFKLKGG